MNRTAAKRSAWANTKFSRWPRREEAMRRYMRLAFQQMGKAGELTSAHNLGHVQRVSFYAGEYVRLMQGGRRKTAMARIAGMAHDRFRDPEDSMKQRELGLETHEVRSAKHLKPILERRYSQRAARTIFEAMQKHGSLPSLKEVGANVVRDALVFADKFFEANGAYIAFRRAMFMAERKDLRAKAKEKGWDLKNSEDLKKAAVEFTLAESKKRIAAFSNLSNIPAHMRPFVQYQAQWQQRLVEGLERGDTGVVNLVTTLFAEGLKDKPRDLGIMIKGYSPIAESDAEFKREALDYLDGKLAKKFWELVKKPD